jgi:hypothetical protein
MSGSQLDREWVGEIGGKRASGGSHHSLDLGKRTGIVGSQQLDAVAAGTLGHIESGIGPAEQRVEVAGDTDVRRGADADRSANRQAVNKSGGIGEGMTHGFARACRLERIGARQDGCKFLAAEASDDARSVEMRLSRDGEQLKHAIAQGMAKAVVGMFEMIEIEDEHCDRVGLQLAVLSDRVGDLEQGAPVGKARQHVGQGLDALLPRGSSSQRALSIRWDFSEI